MTYYVKTPDGIVDQGDILVPMPLKPYLPWWPDDSPLPLVVVTPTCDLAQERADHHRLCVLQPLPFLLYLVGKQLGFLREHWEGTQPVAKRQSQSFRDKLKAAIRNAWPRFHFLPRQTGIFETDYIVDFELIVSIPLASLSPELRHARLNPPYQQELIQRLTSHVMRIGTPDIPIVRVDQVVSAYIGATKLRLES